MLHTFAVAILFTNFLLATSRTISPDPDHEFRIKSTINAKSLNFSILGDWGGFPKPFLTTPIQLSAARLLGKISDRDDSQFTLAIGDNFYFWGVEDVKDDRFQTTFERVYTARSLQRPWYVLLGNHDWQGNYSAEVAYSRFSNRWTMPKPYYTLEYALNNGDGNINIKYIIFDSQIHVDQGDQKDSNKQYPVRPTPEQKEEQLDWLKKELETDSSNQADYLFFISHYQTNTPWSHSKGMDDIDILLHKYKITAHIYGHIHDTHHLRSKNPAADGSGYKMNYICSGIGALMDRPKHDNSPLNDQVDVLYWFHKIKGFKGGFVMSEINEKEAIFRWYYAGGEEPNEVQYEARIGRRVYS